MAIPNTDLIFKDFANGIRNVKDGLFYPYNAKTASAGTVLETKPNRRYFVKSVSLSVAAAAADTGTLATLTGVVNNETVTLASLVKITATADHVRGNFPINVLFDKETSIVFTAADVTAAACQIVYSEVDESG